jgi:Zn-dependent M28 family amino/carboxypeptidase
VLHNWWGNGVFVDYASGNWCEGLTAYLADHLYKEQSGSGAEYRRDTLKKYRDFVREAHDFPLTEFRSRHSPATEAVGYGKALMTFHMLRQRVGDAAYVRGLQRFYREQRGKRASFTDLARAHGAAAAVDLDAFMRQWTTRAGAPELQLRNVRRMPDGRVTGELRQIQTAAPFSLDVPMVLRTAQGVESFVVHSAAASTSFELVPKAQALALEVDPQFDLFRLLHARETAPSLGQMFGDPRVLAVLPAAAPATELAAYRKMLEFWGGGGAQQFEIVTDRQLKQLPADQPVWLFGRGNAWADRSFGNEAAPGFRREADAVVLGTARLAFADRSLVVVRRHPRNDMKAMGWIALESQAAAEGLARKLPHYGKYSWLGFSGTEPTNTDKGEWSTGDSPLRVDLRSPAERSDALPMGGYVRRAALAQLPAVFDAQLMQRDIEWLADPAREGRGPGTAGLAAAADYLAAAFKQAKLKSVAEVAATSVSANANGYFQSFAFTPPGARVPIELRNVIGVLPGTDPRFAGEAVLVTAHYDHLGRSGPGVRMSEVGRVHPGADDNASGVAVILELARAAAGAGLPRTVVFVAFSGEESGLQGSKHFVANAVPVPASGIRSVLNLDTVGRLRDGELSALATDTASEWQHVFRGIGFSTGIAVRNIPGASQSSDQQSFIEKGIPAVQLFTGAHLDYHRPTDTADRIDLDGLVKVATVAREALEYLAQRPTPLSVTIANVAAPVAASAAPRKVSFGLVPDYAHQGEGVKAESVVPQSPAERAGVQAGDVLLSLDGKPVNGLAAFSEALKAYPVGARVRVALSRDGQRLALEVVLQER